MFEGIVARAAAAAERRVRARTRQIAQEAEAALPRHVRVKTHDGLVRFSGRGLRRRFLVEPALRWLTERVR
jgi:hypothetical protein